MKTNKTLKQVIDSAIDSYNQVSDIALKGLKATSKKVTDMSRKGAVIDNEQIALWSDNNFDVFVEVKEINTLLQAVW